MLAVVCTIKCNTEACTAWLIIQNCQHKHVLLNHKLLAIMLESWICTFIRTHFLIPAHTYTQSFPVHTPFSSFYTHAFSLLVHITVLMGFETTCLDLHSTNYTLQAKLEKISTCTTGIRTRDLLFTGQICYGVALIYNGANMTLPQLPCTHTIPVGPRPQTIVGSTTLLVNLPSYKSTKEQNCKQKPAQTAYHSSGPLLALWRRYIRNNGRWQADISVT